MLYIVEKSTGNKVGSCNSARRIVWAPGIVQANPHAGLEYAGKRLVNVVRLTPTGEGTQVRDVCEGSWDGANTWNIPQERWTPTAVVPQSITPRQARLALAAIGKLTEVNALIAQQTEEVQVTWEFALEVRRTDPLVLSFAPALGFTDTDLDNLFIAAAAIP